MTSHLFSTFYVVIGLISIVCQTAVCVNSILSLTHSAHYPWLPENRVAPVTICKLDTRQVKYTDHST